MRAATILTAAVLALAVPAQAAQVCGPAPRLAEKLRAEYGEVLRAEGLIADGKALMQLYVSDSGSWTVVTVSARGVVCVLSAGLALSFVTEDPGDDL